MHRRFYCSLHKNLCVYMFMSIREKGCSPSSTQLAGDAAALVNVKPVVSSGVLV